MNTDGECYTYGEGYGEPDWSIGDIFTTPLSSMLAGEAFERCASAAEKRVALNCLTCPFFQACGGRFVAETDQRDRDRDAHDSLTCMARPIIEYIAQRLQATMPDIVRDRRVRPLARLTSAPNVA